MTFAAPEAAALRLLQAGRLEEAERAWRAILAQRPDDPHALHFLGCVLVQRGQAAEGMALVERSIALAPRDVSFVANYARLLADAGRLEQAVDELRRAVRIDPSFAPGFLQLGTVLHRQGRGEEALPALRRAAALTPRDAGVQAGLGRVLLERGDSEGAYAAFEAALARMPHDPDLLNNSGLALQRLGRIDDALVRYRDALAARPRFPAALVNLGNLLKDAGELERAGDAFERALAMQPDYLPALTNAASIALDREDLVHARALYERALALAPGFADARYGLGLVDLRERRFAEGWAGFAWRFATNPPQVRARQVDLPALADEHLARPARVAVWREQGVGDQVLFSTLLPELAERGMQAVVETDPRLIALYRRSVHGVRFVAPEEAAGAFAACEAQVGLGSLPAFLRRDASEFARQPRALLRPEPARVEAIRERLGPGRWIAISWRSVQGGERRAHAERKSAPLEAFAALALAGFRLLDVQYGDVGAERAAFEARHPGVLTRLPELDVANDLDGLVAAMAACERVVTTSNVTTHLAGAAGLPTSLAFLRRWPPFHYWVDDGSGRSPWYPSVKLPGEAWTTWEQALESLARRCRG